MDGRPRADGDTGPGQNSAYRPLSRDITRNRSADRYCGSILALCRAATKPLRQPARTFQSSSSRQTERAVQALQMGRASSMVPSGSG